MTADELAARNIDFRAALALAARAQKTLDRLEALAASGTILDQAERDALSAGIASVDREISRALALATHNGVDFVVISCEHYVLCYALEAGRWEGFVSHNRWTTPVA